MAPPIGWLIVGHPPNSLMARLEMGTGKAATGAKSITNLYLSELNFPQIENL
jgi:hypothetical protein